ncbi:sugar transporter SWEET1 [Rhynchophorus ferrugineus]|uniref:Sugar transporter SWEET n=1 Tax=Rhynchophorus ferrugineus TaxID=354439 RepID=A0A834J0M4_RHYFE|nr:hypothetical protein GWI33_000077 [Rhynchophorus ferrugineus]
MHIIKEYAYNGCFLKCIIEMQFKNILATSASVCAILQFSTGLLTARKIIHNKSTGDISAFPFVSGLLSTSLWLKYGFLIDDNSLIAVNTIGAIIFFSCVAVFFIYSIKKSNIARQFLISLLVLIIILMRIHRIDNVDESRQTLGFISSGVTILFFASPFASLYHVIKVKNTESLPFYLIASTFIVSLQWLVYGILLEDTFIQIPNFIGSLLSLIQLGLFIIYPSKNQKNYSNSII